MKVFFGGITTAAAAESRTETIERKTIKTMKKTHKNKENERRTKTNQRHTNKHTHTHMAVRIHRYYAIYIISLNLWQSKLGIHTIAICACMDPFTHNSYGKECMWLTVAHSVELQAKMKRKRIYVCVCLWCVFYIYATHLYVYIYMFISMCININMTGGREVTLSEW